MNLLQCTNACRATRATVRRQHLIDTARRLFIERGFHATGVAQIAAASGIKVGQIYRDFQSKEDIIAAIAESDLAAFLDEEGLNASIAANDRAAVRGWIGRFLDVSEPLEQCRMMTEIHAEAARNARIAEIHRSVDRQVHVNLTTALTALIPGPDHAARRMQLSDLIMTLGIGLMNRRITDPELDVTALTFQIERIVDREINALNNPDDRLASAMQRMYSN